MRLAQRALALLCLASLVVALSACDPEPTPTPAPSRRAATPTAISPRPGRAPAASSPPSFSPQPSLWPPSPVSQPAVKRGGLLRAVSSLPYPSLDPQVSTRSGKDGYSLIYEHLLHYAVTDEKTGQSEVQPGLAESFTWIDPQTCVLKMRQGVKFQDGTDWTAAVARWNLDRLRSHPRSVARSYLEVVRSVEVVDGESLKINLAHPSASLPVLLTRAAGGLAPMVSQAAVQSMGEEAFAGRGVGTGPMAVSAWQKDGQLVLKRWDGYWQRGVDGVPLPYLDGYAERLASGPGLALQEVRAGQADLLTESIEPGEAQGVRGNASLVLREMPWAGTVHFLAGFNAGSSAFRNPKLRQAALYALDREALAKTIGGATARPHYYPLWQPATFGYSEDLPRYQFDLNQARQLVKDAGPDSGQQLLLGTLAGQPGQRIGEMVQEMWSQAGLKVKLETGQGMAFHTRVANGEFAATFIYDASPAADPDFIASRLANSDLMGLARYASPAFAKCMQEGRAGAQPAQRLEVYRECQRLIYQDASLGSGFFLPGNRLYAPSVRGLTFELVYADLRQVWLER